MENLVKVMKLDALNSLVIKQTGDEKFFVSTPDSLIISIPNLAVLLKYLVFRGYLHPKILSGIVEEYESNKV